MRLPKAIDIPRRDCDTDASYLALCEYAAMGPSRTLIDMAKGPDAGQSVTKKRGYKTLRNWSSAHGWTDRAHAYDVAVQERQRAKLEEEMVTGLAAPAERVKALKKLFEDVTDLHGTGNQLAVRTNANGLLAQVRGLLDDLAKETGGRIKRSDVRVSKPVQSLTWYDEDEDEEEDDEQG